MSGSIEKLAKSVDELVKNQNKYILEHNERATRFEVQQEHLTTALTEMAVTHKDMIISNVKVEEKLVSLETRAIDRLNVVEGSLNDSVERLNIRIDSANSDIVSIKSKINLLEILNAEENGEKKVKDDNKKFWTANWYKFIGLFIIIVPTVVTIYNLVTHKSTGG